MIKMVERSLLKLFEMQTQDEQKAESINGTNGAGFNKVDAPILTNMAKSLMQYGRLTTNQLAYVRARIYKYAGQLTKIANAK